MSTPMASGWKRPRQRNFDQHHGPVRPIASRRVTRRRALPDFTAEAAIIGCGPVGATLANILGFYGVNTLLIEREDAAYALPRAVHFDDEVMRCFQAIGLAARIAADCHVNPGMLFVDGAAKVLADWSRPMEIGPLGWHASYRFHQPDLERVLRDGLRRYPHVTVLHGVAAQGLRQSDAGADLDLVGRAGGKTSRATARFVIGCDGARSFTRGAIGAELEDLGFDERWLVVDTRLKTPRPDLGDHSIQHCDPDNPATYVRGTGNRRRWEFRLDNGTGDEAAQNPEAVWARLEKWVTPGDAALERAAVYTFRSRLARHWRKGAVLIAGDAAHQTPPFMGQGMCAGIRDAANLGWKLARVLRGRSDPQLIDSYQSERLPHARAYIEMAVAMGQLINKTAAEKLLGADAPQDGAAKRIASIRPPLGPGLGLDRGSGTLTGRLCPQFRLADGTLSDDRAQGRVALYCRAELEMPVERRCGKRLRKLDIALIAAGAPALEAWLAGEDAAGIFVRPDGYVLASAGDTESIAGHLDHGMGL